MHGNNLPKKVKRGKEISIKLNIQIFQKKTFKVKVTHKTIGGKTIKIREKKSKHEQRKENAPNRKRNNIDRKGGIRGKINMKFIQRELKERNLKYDHYYKDEV